MFLKIFTFVKNKLNLLFSRFMCQMLVKMYCKMNIIKNLLLKIDEIITKIFAQFL